MKKLAIALLTVLPLAAAASTDPNAFSGYVLVNANGGIKNYQTNADVAQWQQLGVIHADGSIDPVLGRIPGGDQMVKMPVTQLQPQPQPQRQPNQVPHQVPQAVPQAMPQLTPQLVAQPSLQQAPNQVPQQVPQLIPQAVPQRAPQLASQPSVQKVPQQVPQQVPQVVPQATPQLQPQWSAQQQAYAVSPDEVQQMQHDIAHNRRQADRALDLSLSALAVAELPQATDGRSGLGLGLSSAGGQIGEALGFSSNFGQQNEYTIKLSVSHSGSETAAGVGASYQW